MTTSELRTPIFCGDCGANHVWAGKLAAKMSCPDCGSSNLGLTGVDPRPSVVAKRRAEAAGGTGWTGPDPRRTEGWSEYQGPTPQTNPRIPPVSDPRGGVCPVCHGSGYDPIDKAKCRECGGTGRVTHPTDEPLNDVQNYDATDQAIPSGGAGWRQGGRRSTDPFGSAEDHIRATTPGYATTREIPQQFKPEDSDTYFPKADSRSPMVHVREQRNYSAPAGPYQMDQANCPECGHAPTELRKDRSEDAWWFCPNCGPLANVDAHPEVNPYDKGTYTGPDRAMKTGKRLIGKTRKTGRLLSILATVHSANQLTQREAVGIARRTLQKYGER